jgi:hypothetical protein
VRVEQEPTSIAGDAHVRLVVEQRERLCGIGREAVAVLALEIVERRRIDLWSGEHRPEPLEHLWIAMQ